MGRNVFYVSLKATYARLAYVLDSSEDSIFPLVDAPDTRVLLGALPRANLEDILRQQLRTPRFAISQEGLQQPSDSTTENATDTSAAAVDLPAVPTAGGPAAGGPVPQLLDRTANEEHNIQWSRLNKRMLEASGSCFDQAFITFLFFYP